MASTTANEGTALTARQFHLELGSEVKIPNVATWLWHRDIVGAQRLPSFQEDRAQHVEIDAGLGFQHQEFPKVYEPNKANVHDIRSVGDHH